MQELKPGKALTDQLSTFKVYEFLTFAPDISGYFYSYFSRELL